MIKKLPIYPILFSIFPVLSLAAYNIDQIVISSITRSLVVSLLLGMTIFGLMKLALRSWHRAALVTLAILFIISIYGQVYGALEDITISDLSVFRHRTLLPFFGALLLFLFVIMRKLKEPERFTQWLNLLSIWLLVYPSFQLTSHTLQRWEADRALKSTSHSIAGEHDRPDVYYIILDAYGRQDILLDRLQYDNSEFLDALHQRGFYVATCSQANYAYTEYSLASSLNYDYLENFGAVNHINRVSFLRHSSVRSFFEANGYKTVAFPTGWSITEWKDAGYYVDFEHPTTSLTEFEALAVQASLFRVIDDFKIFRQSNAPQSDLRRLRALSLLENIKNLPGTDENLFVFAHLVIPHPPYSFGPNGEEITFKERGSSYEEIRAAYIDQVKFVNREILEVIDILQKQSKTPPVIILQGDHGPPPELSLTYSEKMPILNAYYLPGLEKKSMLYPSISPVNTFRVVLDSYFDQNLPLLEDQSYYAPNNDKTNYYAVPNSCPGEQ